jgi:crotonobetainyl-CoA:carnitine CoA-transferase CaiB-like acyl-CoA transferase
MLLRDAGATLIKVEPPEGDASRREPGHRVWNRGKQSAVIPEDDARLSEVLATADVVLIGGSGSMRPGWELREDQIVCIAPPYADVEPYRNLPENDALASALSGVLGGTGTFRGGPAFPVMPTLSYAVGVLVAVGAASALRVRAKTGKGQEVCVSWPTAGAYLSGYQASQSDIIPGLPTTSGLDPQGLSIAWTIYEASDDWIGVACANPTFFDRLMIALEIPELTTDPRFETAPYVAPEHTDALRNIFAERIATRTRGEWMEIFAESGVPAAPVLTREQFAASDLVEENNMLATVDDPEVGPVRQIASPFQMSGCPPVPPQAAPFLGADTQANLALAASTEERTPATSASEPVPEHPLSGIRVLDFTGYLAGPTAGRMLAELGAEVIKVEPLTGEGFRSGVLSCVGINMGKKSLAVDTETPEGAEIRDRLIQSADVLLQALLPGAPEKLGIGYERVKQLNSTIVYCRIAGFGNAEKWRDRPSFDLLLQAVSGQMMALGPDNPMYSSIPMADLYAGMVLDYAIVLALSRREQTGEGCYVSTSQVAASLGAQAGEFVEYEGMQAPGDFNADSIGSSALQRYYQAKDGWAILVAEYASTWQRLVDAYPGQLGNWREWSAAEAEPVDGKLASVLGEIVSGLTKAEIVESLTPYGIPLAPVVIVREDGFVNATFNDLNSLCRADRHTMFGTITTVSNFVDFSRTPAVKPRLAQWIGEQNREVLESLGYSEEDVGRFTEAGVIASPELNLVRPG